MNNMMLVYFKHGQTICLSNTGHMGKTSQNLKGSSKDYHNAFFCFCLFFVSPFLTDTCRQKEHIFQVSVMVSPKTNVNWLSSYISSTVLQKGALDKHRL